MTLLTISSLKLLSWIQSSFLVYFSVFFAYFSFSAYCLNVAIPWVTFGLIHFFMLSFGKLIYHHGLNTTFGLWLSIWDWKAEFTRIPYLHRHCQFPAGNVCVRSHEALDSSIYDSLSISLFSLPPMIKWMLVHETRNLEVDLIFFLSFMYWFQLLSVSYCFLFSSLLLSSPFPPNPLLPSWFST
jgi:hypothetical protein